MKSFFYTSMLLATSSTLALQPLQILRVNITAYDFGIVGTIHLINPNTSPEICSCASAYWLGDNPRFWPPTYHQCEEVPLTKKLEVRPIICVTYLERFLLRLPPIPLKPRIAAPIRNSSGTLHLPKQVTLLT